jgi:predicted RNA binding protein YcfA (HicA-like mRNA interferase family)
MSKLPTVTGKQAVAAFEKLGFAVVRVSKSSHHVMKKDGHPNVLTVPVHAAKNLKTGTLRALIRAAGISVERFIEVLN